MTGEQMETEVYLGPTYYERLKHMVKDKINYRAKGPRSVLTRQTIGGRANDGGLRIGEMDRDSIISHGMAQFLNESMMVRGDQYKMAICNKSGTIAIYNESRNLFLSPMADGPIKFVGNVEGDLNIVPISRFGRSFSIVNVPYAFKLLYQELQALNIQMRLITSDNVEQLTSLTKSNNIVRLTGNLTSFKDVKIETQRRLARTAHLPPDLEPSPTPSPSPEMPTPFAPAIQQVGDSIFWQPPPGANPFAPAMPEGVQRPLIGIPPAPVQAAETSHEESSSPFYVPTSPSFGTPDSPGPIYIPASPTPSPESPGFTNLPSVGEMIIWSGDPQPGRVWRIAEVLVPDHKFIIIPGSFTGPDRVTIPFKDGAPLPTQQSPASYDYGDDEYGFMDYGPQDKFTGDPKYYDAKLAKRISEVGYTEAFREKNEKDKAEKNTSLPDQTDKGDGSGEDATSHKPIVIRTPVLEKKVEGVDLLSTIDKDGDEDEESKKKDTNIKLITKKD